MKRVKKLIGLLVAATIIAATPLTAMALPAGGYVPTSGTWYYKDSTTKKWEKSGTVLSYTYKKDGKLTKRVDKYNGGSSALTYTWKGNYITKIASNSADGGGFTAYKYKNKKRTSYQYSGEKAQTIKWKGKTGTYTGDGGKTKYTINGKGQLVKITTTYDSGYVYTTTYKYSGGGNLKSVTGKGKDSKGKTTSNYLMKYNKKGYPASRMYSGTNYSDKTTYKYKTKKGKLREVVVNSTYKEGGSNETYSYRVVFTKWKKVSHIRNCDAYGNTIGLGW